MRKRDRYNILSSTSRAREREEERAKFCKCINLFSDRFLSLTNLIFDEIFLTSIPIFFSFLKGMQILFTTVGLMDDGIGLLDDGMLKETHVISINLYILLLRAKINSR